MSREKRSGPVTTRAARTTINQAEGTALPRGESMPRARASFSPPCAGRALGAVWVGRCPWCTSAHVHRVGEVSRLLSGRVTRCCPVWGKRYVLAPVRRQRTAVRRAAG
jgi:hypothetical protein